MMYTRLKNIKKVVSWYYRLYIRRETPVIVFAPGRVGSMALHKNLTDAGVFAFKVEFTHDDHTGAASFVHKHIFYQRKKAKIITIVREPISLMATYFFSKATRLHVPEAQEALQRGDTAALNRLFVRNALSSDRLNPHLYWYERDFKIATGIDIFSHPFDTEAGSSVIDDATYPTLILRTEMDDGLKGNHVAQFLGINSLTITRENVRGERRDAELYEAFKKTINVPDNLLEKIYSSPLALHFLTPAERNAAVVKYSGSRNP